MTRSSLTVVILILVLVSGGYLYFKNYDSSQTSQGPSLREEAGREYSDEQYGFSLVYPEGMTVEKFDEGGGASSFVFEDIQNMQGFQIFVVPYGESQISEERFL